MKLHGITKLTILAITLTISALYTWSANAGVEENFTKFDKTSQETVDHSAWNKLLKAYVKTDSSGLNRVDYSAFKRDGHQELKNYVKALEAVDVTKLNRDEQFAFWANLYNAKTIDIVLEHYPTRSIKDIDISPGLFADGPWKKKVMTVNGIRLSLDDVEHNILRKLWKDPRVHYAVNCASVGCPNLNTSAFTGADLNEQLDVSAKAFINNERGLKIDGKRVIVSKIYSWFRRDFGSSEQNILKHIKKYTSPENTKKLDGITDIYSYRYDWSLNDAKKN